MITRLLIHLYLLLFKKAFALQKMLASLSKLRMKNFSGSGRLTGASTLTVRHTVLRKIFWDYNIISYIYYILALPFRT